MSCPILGCHYLQQSFSRFFLLGEKTNSWLRSAGNAALCNICTSQCTQTFLAHDLGCKFCCWFAFLQLKTNLLWVILKQKQKIKLQSGLKICLEKKKKIKYFFFTRIQCRKESEKGRGRSFSLRFNPWLAKPLFLCWPLFPLGAAFSSWNGEYSRAAGAARMSGNGWVVEIWGPAADIWDTGVWSCLCLWVKIKE